MASPKSGVPIRDVPSALDRREEIVERIGNRTPALFLDYDGTLTPIVDDPAEATLPSATRVVLRIAAARMPVAVISGRDLADVRRMVGLDGLWYAGSHGFDLVGPQGEREQRATDALPALDGAEAELRRAVEEEFSGAWVERKRFAIAVHYRRMSDERVPALLRRVRELSTRHPDLRPSGGKKVIELRPDVDWDKGRAVCWLWDVLDLEGSSDHPVYVGDDVTDEDAFRAIRNEVEGTGIVVLGESDERRTLAHYSLEAPSEVRVLVDMFIEEKGRE